MKMRVEVVRVTAIILLLNRIQAWETHRSSRKCHASNPTTQRGALSSRFLENDLIAIRRPTALQPRLCAVKPDGTVVPLCLKEDDVSTDLFADPREYASRYWTDPEDAHVAKVYGEGYYGQRPVPSLGGGPGYGAEADEVWSVTEDLLDEVRRDGVELPVLDVGIAHGEKARGGSL